MSKAKNLTPAMRRVVEILHRDGYVDKIDGISVNTIVALMDRGILREATPLGWGATGRVHFAATTPTQVEAEAYAEHRERFPAIVIDSPTWGDVRPGGVLVTQERSAAPVEVRRVERVEAADAAGAPYRWVWGPGDGPVGWHSERELVSVSYDLATLHAEAENEDESRSIAMGKGQGWGQPDGMLSPSTEPAWTPAAGDTVLHGRDDTTAPRPFGRVLLVDGLKVKVEWPGGVGWHWAHELEHHPMPSDRLARAEIRESETHTAAVKAAVDGGSGNAEIAKAYADHGRAAEELRTAVIASGKAPYEYPAPYAMGPTSRAAQALPIVPNTPAEARTGISDRAAVALRDVAEMRSWTHTTNLLPVMVAEGLRDRLDRIEAALRGGR